MPAKCQPTRRFLAARLAAALPRWETAEVAAPADLEALVRAESREPVAALVRKLVPELVAEQLNGHALAVTVAAAEPEEAEEPPRPPIS